MIKKVQTSMEYAFLIMVVVVALTGMAVYTRRSIGANLRTTQDQLNTDVSTGVLTPGGTTDLMTTVKDQAKLPPYDPIYMGCNDCGDCDGQC